MTQGESASRIVVYLKNGEREIYDSSYYNWEIWEGMLEFHDEDCNRQVLYSMNNVHKVEIQNPVQYHKCGA